MHVARMEKLMQKQAVLDLATDSVFRICLTFCTDCGTGWRAAVPANGEGRLCPACGRFIPSWNWNWDHFLTAVYLCSDEKNDNFWDYMMARGRFRGPGVAYDIQDGDDDAEQVVDTDQH
jgi:hypothetical protein